MTDNLNNIVIVFNGEIYNSAELRKDLEKIIHLKQIIQILKLLSTLIKNGV